MQLDTLEFAASPDVFRVHRASFTKEMSMRQDGMANESPTRRMVVGFLPIIAIMLGFGGVLMSQASASAAAKNVVLVHGGFVDGSGWQGVHKALKKDGYAVTIVQNPTFSLADDVAVTKRTLAAQSGIRVNCVGGAPTFQFRERLAEIFQDLAVDELDLAFGSHDGYQAGKGIDDQAKTLLARAEGVLGAPPILEIGIRPVPLDDPSRLTRTGLLRKRNRRNAPSTRRRRPSTSKGCPDSSACWNISNMCGRSSG